MEENSKIPRTADGYIIYPGMPVYICDPFSMNKYVKATVYCVIGEEGSYEAVIEENRHFDGECWDDGNTEAVDKLFVNKENCLKECERVSNK